MEGSKQHAATGSVTVEGLISSGESSFLFERVYGYRLRET